jgi:hypothetical protein
MASNRMSAALSVLMTRNFSKMFLRARRALEFSHGLGPSRHFAAAQQFGRIWSEADINHRAGFMMGWTPPDGIGVPKVEVLSTT